MDLSCLNSQGLVFVILETAFYTCKKSNPNYVNQKSACPGSYLAIVYSCFTELCIANVLTLECP